MTEAIGRGTWLDKVAYEVLNRERVLGRSTGFLRVESGLGASGTPHVGSVGDAIRAYGVKEAFENLGSKSELVAYSDDMDGLRKVPKGLPDWLHKYIATPVNVIPDPFDCHQSYGAHMSSMLLDALDRLKVDYRFQSGCEAYRKGLLNSQIKTILENSKAIGAKIAEMLGQKKFEEVLPYYPICEGCGRIYLAEAYMYVPSESKVLYRCAGAKIAGRFIEGCGREGEVKVTEGKGKLSWKGEFAARWSALNIRFEAYGKDIADSVKVNDWVSDEILGYPHPSHIKYELFLDRSGRKISKSLGNVFTPQVWLRYGSPQSLLLLMYKRVAGTRNLSPSDVPHYMDEYDALEDVYFGKVRVENAAALRKMKGLYEYIHHLKPPEKPSVHVLYGMLVQMASVAPREDRVNFLVKRLLSYGVVREADPEMIRKIGLAANWADDFNAVEKPKVTLSDVEKKALSDLIRVLRVETDAKLIQNQIFEVSKHHGIDTSSFFKTIYKVILGAEKGPRLGPYIVDIGHEKVAQMLLEQIE